MRQHAEPDAHDGAPLPDLGDTRTAFADKSDHELRRAAWMFRFIGVPWLTAIGWWFTRAALALRLPVKRIVKAMVFRQFCGGETIGECVEVVARLNASGIGTILDHGVEGQDDEEALDATMKEVLRTIAVAGERPDRFPFCVFKPTGISRTQLLADMGGGKVPGLGDRVEWQRVEERMERLCEAAHRVSVPLLVDAEESWLQQAIDGLVERMMERFNRERAIVFNTVQLYRHDRLAFLMESHAKALAGGYFLGVKLVRGAYLEKERARAKEMGYASPLHADKAAVDRDYDAALRFCAERIDRISVCVGTHNEESVLSMARTMADRGIPRDDRRVWFSQLMGMGDHISYNMAAAGYRVAKYVPYGPLREVLPYLVRRAAENTSVMGQTGRELGLILTERKRRAGG